jgi:biopolymer transport protein ExbB
MLASQVLAQTAPATTDSAAPAATAPATDAASTPVPPPQPAAVEVENPYGVKALWNEGDIVGRSTLIILGIMSLGTWYIMISKIIEQARLLSAAKAATRTFWKGGSAHEGVKTLKENSPFRFIAENAIDATEHHEGTLVEQIDLHTWVTMSIQRAVEEVQSRLQGGLAFLATVGSTSPFIGLFGTVLGIYHALTAIGIAGQASIDKVAGPVGEALLMTAFGLFTAVPAVLGYNWLVRRNKSCMEKTKNFAADLHSILLSGPKAEQVKSTARIA